MRGAGSLPAPLFVTAVMVECTAGRPGDWCGKGGSGLRSVTPGPLESECVPTDSHIILKKCQEVMENRSSLCRAAGTRAAANGRRVRGLTARGTTQACRADSPRCSSVRGLSYVVPSAMRRGSGCLSCLSCFRGCPCEIVPKLCSPYGGQTCVARADSPRHVPDLRRADF